MATWRATQAKSQFSAVLDQAENEGPQLIERRRKRFFLLTEDQLKARSHEPPQSQKPFLSAWDALQPSFTERFDLQLPRGKGGLRKVNLE